MIAALRQKQLSKAGHTAHAHTFFYQIHQEGVILALLKQIFKSSIMVLRPTWTTVGPGC